MGGRESEEKRIRMRGLIWIGLSGGNEEKCEEQESCYKRDLMRESIGLEEEKKMRRMGEKNEDYWKENEEEWAANEETSEERERRERDRWVSYKRANATCHPAAAASLEEEEEEKEEEEKEEKGKEEEESGSRRPAPPS